MSQQLQATGNTKVLDQVVEHAKLLMILQEQATAVTSEDRDAQASGTSIAVDRAGGSTKYSYSTRMVIQDVAFTATSLGMPSATVQTNVRNESTSRVEDQATLQKNAGREMAEGRLQGAAGVPHISKP